MKRPIRALFFAMAIGLVAAFPLAVGPVAAHGHVIVGQYELTVGWRGEPAVAGYLNGLDLGVQHHFSNGTTAWVVGVAGNLTATLMTGQASVPKALEPQFGRDGWYTFDVIPTRVGTYSVRFYGTLGSTPVDVKVNLDDVSPASDLAFPIADPTSSDLQSRLNDAIAGLQLLLIIALVVACLGLLVAAVGVVLGWRMSRTQRKTP
jgi:hypothetical protein